MEEIYSKLTQYEKKSKWSSRFSSIYRLYLSKLWAVLIKDTKTWIFNALMILPVIAGPIIALFTKSSLSYDVFFSTYSDIMFVGYFGLIIPLFTMYIASMMFNDETNDRTLTYLTTRPIHRFELVLVKYLSFLTIIPIFTAVTTGLVYLSFGIFGGFRYWDAALWYFLAAFIASVVYGAFFMFMGLLFKNPLWFGLFFVFIWEFVLASFSQTLNNITIAYYIKSLIVYDLYPNDPFRGSPAIFAGNQADTFSFLANPASALTFSVVLTVIVIVSLTLAWSRLQGDKFKVPYQAGRRPGGWKYYLKEIRSFLITFGIVFITIGLIIGPVNGTSKTVRRNTDANITVHEYPDWAEGTTPSLSDMGYASTITYSFSKGDSITIRATKTYTNTLSHQVHAIIIEKEIFDNFVGETQILWMDYQEDYYAAGGSGGIYFPSLIADYSTLANDVIEEANTGVFLNSDAQQSFTFTTPERGTYYVVAIVSQFSTTESYYFNADIRFDINGNVHRIAGYAFGWTLFGVGLVISGFSIYSLITYSSADEIKRYEEQLKLASSKEEGSLNAANSSEEKMEEEPPPAK